MPDPAPRGSTNLDGRVLLFILAVSWGLTWPAMKFALDELPPFAMRTASMTLGAAMLMSLALLRGRNLRLTGRRAWIHMAIAAVFNIAAFNLFIPFAQLNAATSRVAIIAYTMPIWATLLAAPILGERFDMRRIIALILCIVGMTTLIYPLAASGIPLGIMLALGAAVSWAIGTVYLKWARIEGDPLAIAAWQVSTGLVMIAIGMTIFEGPPRLWPLHWTAIAGLLFSGLIGSGLAYFLWFEIIQKLPAMTASLGALMVPVVGVLSSMLLLGEHPSATDIIGFGLIFAASACVLLEPPAVSAKRS
jgi:drug/metabolite transporter (DMT)-like permease